LDTPGYEDFLGEILSAVRVVEAEVPQAEGTEN